MALANDTILIGIDGGATKVSAVLVTTDNERHDFSCTGKTVSIEYRNSAEFDPQFKPVDLATQLAQMKNENYILTPEEKCQGDSIIESVAICIIQLLSVFTHKKALVGIGFPGLKTPDRYGIAALANGPRMPEFNEKLKKILTQKGLKLAGSIGYLGSDADYCGIGENYAAEGKFRSIKNGYYLGGGTGVADALKLKGSLVTFDSANSWIAKTWEFKSGGGISFERYISANGIQFLYSRAIGKSQEYLSEKGIFLNEIFDRSETGELPAIDTLGLVKLYITTLLHERISTIYSGFKGQLQFINNDRKQLSRNHKYHGTLLNSIIIGQRLSEFFLKAQRSKIWWNDFLSSLGDMIQNDESLDAQAKNHYLKNNLFNSKIIQLSMLREAPALGAAIDRYFTFISKDEKLG